MNDFKRMLFIVKNDEHKSALSDRLIEWGYEEVIPFMNRGSKYLVTSDEGKFAYVAKVDYKNKVNTLDDLYDIEVGKKFVSHLGRIRYEYGFDEICKRMKDERK